MTLSGLSEQKYKPGTPFNGRYFIKNPFFNICFRLLDLALAVIFSFKKKNKLPLPPLKNVLLVNPTHLGDVVMSTAVLPVFKKNLPQIKIGFLCASWSQKILKEHPLIDRIHCVDHWKLNRSDLTRWQKIKRYLSSTARTFKELKDVKYDAVFVLYPYYPNLIPLFFFAGIPIRVGYETAGFGPLLTHIGVWDEKTLHLAEHQANLLNFFTPCNREGALQYSLPCDPALNKDRVEKFGLPSGSYIIMHMGSGSIIKEWPLEKWRSLTQRLNRMGHTLVFTGQSERENKNIEWVINGITNCINMCALVEWSDFFSLIQQAKLIISVDTLTSHLAAAFKIPYVVLMTGLVNTQLIRPLGGRGTVLTTSVPCSPCYRKQGCPTMDCVQNVGVEEVYQATQDLLHYVSPISKN